MVFVVRLISCLSLNRFALRINIFLSQFDLETLPEAQRTQKLTPWLGVIPLIAKLATSWSYASGTICWPNLHQQFCNKSGKSCKRVTWNSNSDNPLKQRGHFQTSRQWTRQRSNLPKILELITRAKTRLSVILVKSKYGDYANTKKYFQEAEDLGQVWIHLNTSEYFWIYLDTSNRAKMDQFRKKGKGRCTKPKHIMYWSRDWGKSVCQSK